VGIYTSVAIGTDGFPVVSYYDTTNADLKLYHCGNAACNGGTPAVTTLDATGSVGTYTSVAIGTDTFPVVSYYDATNLNLKLYHCGNVACTSGAATTLDSTGDVGQYTSLAIGTDTFPVVSYSDVTNTALKFTHCTNVACTGFDSPTTLDDAGSVGQYTAVAIGAEGFPVVSYYDVTNAALKLYHCTHTACTSGAAMILDNSGVTSGSYTSIAIGTDSLPVISYYYDGDLRFSQATMMYPGWMVDTSGRITPTACVASHKLACCQ
jgi:hypothetical protein